MVRFASSTAGIDDFVAHAGEVFDAMSGGLWICDTQPELVYVNQPCERLNDIRSREVCGKSVNQLLGMGNFDRDVTSLVVEERRPMAILQRVRSGRTLLVQGVPIFDADNELRFIVGSECDIADLDPLARLLPQSRSPDGGTAESGMVAESPAMRRVLDLAMRVARYDTTVLITGPTGSGKSALARAIHRRSRRAAQPFLVLNCGAIAPNLLEAELFGYAPGAFTGAGPKGKPGLVEAADGGTLFLDEVDSLPRDLQVKLLTFLDDRSFLRVGDVRPRQVDVRILAATNADLRLLVRDGAFRQDLYFRLDVLPIALPPLTGRPEDILALAGRITAGIGLRFGRPVTLGPGAAARLCRHEYSGNVRELQNLLERAAVLSDDGIILPDHLGDEPAADAGGDPAGLQAALDALEARMLREAWSTAENQQDIADNLLVSQPTIARLLKKHGFATPRSRR